MHRHPVTRRWGNNSTSPLIITLKEVAQWAVGIFFFFFIIIFFFFFFFVVHFLLLHLLFSSESTSFERCGAAREANTPQVFRVGEAPPFSISIRPALL